MLGSIMTGAQRDRAEFTLELTTRGYIFDAEDQTILFNLDRDLEKACCRGARSYGPWGHALPLIRAPAT
jgi:hypothetical protein